uniref:Serine carboxypeptidase S28 family protein n=1 Tax=Tanacetum cinerariifolium TaxID=118510 RepID=A0A6L2L6H9_TANCI|nr:serine carboxypeptidase S28 family protein [Tanacetum cinerariifolium]
MAPIDPYAPLFLHPADGHGSLPIQEGWLMASVYKSIAKSIMFVSTDSKTWIQLEKRFALKLDSMADLPRLTTLTPEINGFLAAINTQKEEQRLFQFLNGLDDHFNAQRSQLLSMTPLPTVESACALLQQEESQRDVFGSSTSSTVETTALYNKQYGKEKCTICGFKWHPLDKYSEKIGYPVWHYKHKQNQSKNKPRNVVKQGNGNYPKRSAETVESGHIMFTSKQFEQLMKNLPHFAQCDFKLPTDTDDELDSDCMVDISWYYCLSTSTLVLQGWIIDTGLDNNEGLRPGLGYVSNSNLKNIPCVPVSKRNEKLDVCMTFPMAKFAKLLCVLSESYAAESFHLIHIDIWGAYKEPTNGKFKYFLTIVNDHSRATWTYLLVQKSDACSVLVAFFTFVQTQFDKKVKVVRSNNALELLKGSLGPYFTEQGIEHQTSCVDRPQQNGRVERKHRHILEVSRALRFHAHLPLSYWGDSILDPEWCKAVDVELTALELNGTWEITNLPTSKKAISFHWIYKTKLKADGNEDRKKARLVVDGNRQRKWVDYEETFALMAKMVILPLGYTGQGECVKNVPRSRQADYSLFTKKDDHSFTAVLIYVDDLLITCTSAHKIQELKQQLSLHFRMKDLGQLSYFLGLEVSKSKQARCCSRSSVEAEYRAMTLTYCKVTWLVALLKYLRLKDLGPVDLKCDNQAAIHIAANLVFHARTKHIEVDCHYVRDQVKSGFVQPSYVPFKTQIADVFTKVLLVDQHNTFFPSWEFFSSFHSQHEGECKSKGVG